MFKSRLLLFGTLAMNCGNGEGCSRCPAEWITPPGVF